MKESKIYVLENESLKTVVYNTIELMTPRSAWRKGVQAYALELLDDDYMTLDAITGGKNELKKDY